MLSLLVPLAILGASAWWYLEAWMPAYMWFPNQYLLHLPRASVVAALDKGGIHYKINSDTGALTVDEPDV